MTPGSPALSAEGLTVAFGRVEALSDVSLEIPAGARVAVLGPNGAGKSTLLRTLAGLAVPFAGGATVDGVPLSGMDTADRARTLATVLTEREVPHLLKAREVVALGRHPHTGFTGRLSAGDHAVVAWALQAMGAAHLAERRAGTLSDGERQRVLTARALAQQPSVLLLDEPTAFLDVAGKVKLTGLLWRHAREHDLAVVMCTHDLELALRLADRVWLVHGGALRSGTPADLVGRGVITEVFDSEDLAFDPENWVFRPRVVPGQA
jgi:iron complex transport system ATP-binding protein